MYHLPISTQTVTISGTSAATTNAVGTHTKRVRLISTIACHVVFGPAPTAVAGDMYIAPEREEIFMIRPGDKVAVIQDAAGGTLYVTEMTN